MPELPEVERAARLVRETALNRRVVKVDVTEDNIVFSGTTHTEFANEVTGRKVIEVGRYGKVFYLNLDGDGRMPVLHFGMTGMLQIKGQLATYYKETPRKASTDWPPRFMKFILHLQEDGFEEVTELAFLDARRLGRIRLCASPLTEPPISTLGFDPLLSMPSKEDFRKGVLNRSCPIKALILDQSFSAGVGNWVADEVLYHSRVHPEQRCNTLSSPQLDALYFNTSEVCRIAVEAHADDSKFPGNWLFKHRWGKGKKQKHTMKLPDGSPATIKWITVGGRTSAYVAELQKISAGATADVETQADAEGGSDLTTLSEDLDVVAVGSRKRKKSSSGSKRLTKIGSSSTPIELPALRRNPPRYQKRRRTEEVTPEGASKYFKP